MTEKPKSYLSVLTNNSAIPIKTNAIGLVFLWSNMVADKSHCWRDSEQAGAWASVVCHALV
jgi:hypothetical protein